MKIAVDVLNVLANSETNENSLRLGGQLNRSVYVSVNKVLELAGGKWNRKTQTHVFPSDAAEIIDQIILTGEITDKKKELGYFPTPHSVVMRLLELADVQKGHLVLEPSAGRGAIAFELLKVTPFVDSIEIDPENADFLISARTHSVTTADFLTIPPNRIYDRVVMNPPFAKNAAPKHVLHAYLHLKPGGRLVAVMPSGVTFRTDSLNREVRANALAIHALPENSFAAAGTAVSTVIVVMDKP